MMSPTKRTRSTARNGCPMLGLMPGNAGGPNTPRSRSAAVKTCTFGSASAALASTPVMAACASSERTNVTLSAPSRGRFSTYSPSPRRKRGSSLRRTRLPRMLRRAAYRDRPERTWPSGRSPLLPAMDSPVAPSAETRSSGPLTAVLAGVVLVVGIVFISQATYANAWYSAFKTVHVIAAIVWIGGGTLLTILGVAAERKRDPIELANIARQAATVGEKVFAPAGLVVVAMGIAMMLNTDWGWGKFWIVAGLVGYAITFVT